MPAQPGFLFFVGSGFIAAFAVVLILVVPLFASGASSPIEVLSFQNTGATNPAGPTVTLSVRNTGSGTIISLIAWIAGRFSIPFTGISYVTPLHPGDATSTTDVVVGWGFTCGASYALDFQGMYLTGDRLNTTVGATITCTMTGVGTGISGSS